MKYLPDYGESVIPEKRYFYGIYNTLYQNETSALISQAKKKRWVPDEVDQSELISLAEQVYTEIQNQMIFPSR